MDSWLIFLVIEYKSSLLVAQAYSESIQTSWMEFFVKIVNGYQPLTIFEKSSILDVSLDLEFTSGECTHKKLMF